LFFFCFSFGKEEKEEKEENADAFSKSNATARGGRSSQTAVKRTRLRALLTITRSKGTPLDPVGLAGRDFIME